MKTVTPEFIDTTTTDEFKLKTPGFAFNVTTFSTRSQSPFSVGFLSDFNVYLTSSQPEYEYNDFTGTADHIGTGFGFDAILGPGINVDIIPSLSVMTGIGIHMDLAFMPSNNYALSSYTSLGFGVGNITRLNWNFIPGMGLMLGFDLAYDFLGLFDGLNESTFEGDASAFSFTPVVAISFSTQKSTASKTAPKSNDSDSGNKNDDPYG